MQTNKKTATLKYKDSQDTAEYKKEREFKKKKKESNIAFKTVSSLIPRHNHFN